MMRKTKANRTKISRSGAVRKEVLERCKHDYIASCDRNGKVLKFSSSSSNGMYCTSNNDVVMRKGGNG